MKVTRILAVFLAVATAQAWAEQGTRRSRSESSDEKKKDSGGAMTTSSGTRSSRPSSGERSDSDRGASRRPSTSSSSPSMRDAERHPGRPGSYRGGSPYRGRPRILVGHYGPHYHGRVHYRHSCYDHGTSYIFYDTPYYRHHYHYYDRDGAVRVLVDPSETRVYVDGYYAGVSDDFDGIFQRLYVSPGRHDIALKLDGYRTQRFKVYVPRGRTFKLHHDMVKGEGEVVEDMAATDEPILSRDERDDDEPAPSDVTDERGNVVLNVTPEDASVYVDGEFHGTGRSNDGLSLSSGPHQIEVVRPGYRTYEREVDVRPGRTLEIDIDLKRS